MKLSSKIQRIEKKVHLTKEEKSRSSFMKRFLDARRRGLVLCKDGVERTVSEWAELAGIDLSILENDACIEEDSNENKQSE